MANLPLGGEDDPEDRLASLFGPSQIDHLIRQAVQFCWMGLPKDRRTADEVEAQIRRMVDRALQDFREDRRAFGVDIES